jgi:hypothetical protein
MKGGLCHKGNMKVDKGQFDEVLRRMLKEPPKKTAEIKAEKKKSKTFSEVRVENVRSVNPAKRRTVSANASFSFRRLNVYANSSRYRCKCFIETFSQDQFPEANQKHISKAVEFELLTGRQFLLVSYREQMKLARLFSLLFGTGAPSSFLPVSLRRDHQYAWE